MGRPDRYEYSTGTRKSVQGIPGRDVHKKEGDDRITGLHLPHCSGWQNQNLPSLTVRKKDKKA